MILLKDKALVTMCFQEGRVEFVCVGGIKSLINK